MGLPIKDFRCYGRGNCIMPLSCERFHDTKHKGVELYFAAYGERLEPGEACKFHVPIGLDMLSLQFDPNA